MQVRPATPEDAEALPDLHSATVEAFGPDGYDATQVERWAKRGERTPDDYPVEEPGEHVTVCVRDDEVAGFGHLAVDEAAVHAVYVHPDHARCGVGSALLAELEGFARGRGTDELSLQSSLNAVGFYERAGWRREGSERRGTDERERSDTRADDRLAEGESPGGLPVVEMRKTL